MPDYYALLGVSPVEGGNEQEAAEPAAEAPQAPENETEQQLETGAEEQDVAEPAQEADEDEGTGDQSAEERHQQAAARRERQRAEQQAQIETRLKTQYEGKISEILNELGLTDPANENRQVKTLEDFEAWKQGQRTAKLRRDLRSGNLSEESLQTAIMQMPQVRALAEKAAAAEEAVRQAEYQQNVGIQMAQIRRMNPDIHTVHDIVQSPCGPKFAEYVRKGLNFEEAYRLADADGIAQRARRAGLQQARNESAGKKHMVPIAGSGQPQGVIPDREMWMYRQLNPGMSDEQIRKAWENKRKG